MDICAGLVQACLLTSPPFGHLCWLQAQTVQEAAAAKADVTRLQGQLEAAGRLQEELGGLRQQLAQAAQREAALQKDVNAAQQDAELKATQVSRSRTEWVQNCKNR